jgi:two-component system LytT family sensor kinase
VSRTAALPAVGTPAGRRISQAPPPVRARERRLARLRLPAVVLACWVLVGLFRAIERYTLDPTMQDRLEFGFREALAQNLLAAFLWALFTPLVVWIARRWAFFRAGKLGCLPPHAVASVLLPVAHCTLFLLAYPALMGVPYRLATQLRALPAFTQVFFLTQFLTYWGIVGVVWAVDSFRLSKERALRASQLEAQLADARLEALKMQLHPHFLFNSLNSILPLVFRDRDAAARTVVRLGDLLRLSLASGSTPLISLAEEIEFLKLYLEIQKTRFQDRLTVALQIDPDVIDARVPNLILQPLVENAVKHGVAGRPGAVHVEVRGFRDGSTLVLRVKDDGVGLPEGSHPESKAGVGWRNTRGRLQHLYDGRFRFDWANVPQGGLSVTLQFPLSFAPPGRERAAGPDFGA